MPKTQNYSREANPQVQSLYLEKWASAPKKKAIREQKGLH